LKAHFETLDDDNQDGLTLFAYDASTCHDSDFDSTSLLTLAAKYLAVWLEPQADFPAWFWIAAGLECERLSEFII